jgi:hypothetical protein
MAAWARAGRTAASPPRLARSAPPLRGCGLDRISPARRGLAKRSRFEMCASAPFFAHLPGRNRALPDRNRSFACERSGAILRRCPDHAPAWAFYPTIFTSSRNLGRASGARPGTMSRRGLSRIIGRTLCRSPTPSSTCSKHGSATCSTNCSGHADEMQRAASFELFVSTRNLGA